MVSDFYFLISGKKKKKKMEKVLTCFSVVPMCFRIGAKKMSRNARISFMSYVGRAG